MTSIAKSIKDAIKFVFLNIIAFSDKNWSDKISNLFFCTFYWCKNGNVSFNKGDWWPETFQYTTIITCANEIITLAWFATGSKVSAPNIIDFPSYRVVLCSLSERYYGAHTTLQIAKLPREPITVRRANLLDKLIKLTINLGRPCAPVVYETVEESFIMRTMQLPLEEILSSFLRICTSKDTRSFANAH